jgi:hypothetical protein
LPPNTRAVLRHEACQPIFSATALIPVTLLKGMDTERKLAQWLASFNSHAPLAT